MTRVQFLNDLYHHLYGMTQEQAEQHLTYYAEMLADRMEEGMSEEEAVAGMEDVETIARRIMEGEGLPYTPPDQRPVVPPAYPDASRLSGGGGTRAYQAPKKANWRKIAQTALWIVAIIAVIGAVKRWGFKYAGTPQPVRESAYAEEYAGDWDYGEAPLMEGFEYAGEPVYISSGDVKAIDVEWASGMVSVDSWNEDDICITEYSTNELSGRTQMETVSDGSTLTIRYRQGSGLGNVRGQKWLSILIPDGMMGEIDISTASAAVQVYSVELDTLRINTASGPVTTDQCFTQTTQIQTISGDVMCYGLYADQTEVTTTSGDITGNCDSKKVEASSTSGDIQLSLELVEEIGLNTVSGDIWANTSAAAVQMIGIGTISGNVDLSLPYNMGFTLNYSTVSGEINLSSFDGGIFSNKSGTYTYNGGGCEIKVETTSGDVEIY